MTMLRDINVVVDGKLDSTDGRVGVLASEIPTGFPLSPFLLNDIDAGFPNRLYAIEILTLPSAGKLFLNKAGVGTFSGAPEGAYTGTQRVRKYDPGVGMVSDAPASYTLQVSAAVPVEPTVTGVAVTPANAVVAGGAAQQFNAVASGTNNPPQTFDWETTGGQVSENGLATAPAAISTSQTVTVTATSKLNPNAKGTATYTVPALVVEPPVSTVTGVLVLPGTATGSQQFSRTVLGENNPSQAGTWSTPFGSISVSGYFTEPARTEYVQTFKVRFTSEQNPDVWGEATVTIPALAETPNASTRSINIVLGEQYGPAANLTDVMVSVHAATGPHDTGAALFQSSVETTDENGALYFSFVSTLGAGTIVLLAVLMPDGRHYLGLQELE